MYEEHDYTQLIFFDKQVKKNQLIEDKKKREELFLNLESEYKKNTHNLNYDNLLLNFNYFYYFHIFRDTKIPEINVHGTIDKNNIIFGIDETADVAKGAEIFKKTYRKLFLTGTQKDLPETCDYISFFGHSLAKADYSYFQSLFDLYDIYGGKTKLIFFVNDQPLPDNPYETKENVLEKTNAVYKLIHDYGEGTLGGQKGNNLLHKLLLENRIQIVKVSDIPDFPNFDEPRNGENSPETGKVPVMSGN